MKCVWTEKVSLLIDGELPQAEAHETERHLDLCADCQSAREDFLLFRRQLADYPLALDAFARQRALKRILAAGGNANSLEHAAVAPTPRRRESFAGVFGMPRLKPAGLAALLLLLVGLTVGVVSLMNSRRPPVEVASHEPAHAPAANNSNNNSSAPTSTATSNAPAPTPDGLTASKSESSNAEQVAGSDQKLTGAEAARDASERAAQDGARTGANARRIESAGSRVPKSSSTPANVNRRQGEARIVEEARNEVAATRGVAGAGDANDAGDNVAVQRETEEAEAGATAGESKTARHVEQAQLLLRSFRNARPADAGHRASSDLAYEKQRSKKLLYENIVLRREAASRGNLPVESLLDSLEPILIDIANLPDKPAAADVREINERMRRKNLVAMLQISAVESASARSY